MSVPRYYFGRERRSYIPRKFIDRPALFNRTSTDPGFLPLPVAQSGRQRSSSLPVRFDGVNLSSGGEESNELSIESDNR